MYLHINFVEYCNFLRITRAGGFNNVGGNSLESFVNRENGISIGEQSYVSITIYIYNPYLVTLSLNCTCKYHGHCHVMRLHNDT